MIKNLPITRLREHPNNPRKDLGDLTELTESIKQNGILQNLTVVESSPTSCTVIIGHRRLAAAKKAGLETVPCIIAEMTEKEQVATMLTENMQREDLTVYEQAQGFQMMLDLGESVNDISEKTGLSDTTVRKRVKLLDLDREKFKESESRNVTLQEYASLEQIKDLELRNEVLEYAGTSNFNNQLKKAIESEESGIKFNSTLEKIKMFATEAENTGELNYVRSYGSWNGEEVEVPEDAGEERYFYESSPGTHWSIYLYRERAKEQEETEEERAKRERKEELAARSNALEKVSKRAYELRKEFAKNVSNAKAKEKIGWIIKHLIDESLDTHIYLNREKMEEIIGHKLSEDKAHIKEKPEKHLFAMAYCFIDCSSLKCHNWRGPFYEENEELNQAYDFLKEFGYEISDEEKALKDGTHELYEEEEE